MDESGENDEMKCYNAEFLLSDDVDSADLDCEVSDIIARMRLSGKMYVCAYLHSRATVREAVEAIKVDLMRSITGNNRLYQVNNI